MDTRAPVGEAGSSAAKRNVPSKQTQKRRKMDSPEDDSYEKVEQCIGVISPQPLKHGCVLQVIGTDTKDILTFHVPRQPRVAYNVVLSYYGNKAGCRELQDSFKRKRQGFRYYCVLCFVHRHESLMSRATDDASMA
jgi:hypothetical protein